MRQFRDKRTEQAFKKVNTLVTKIAGITHYVNPKTFPFGYVEGYCMAEPNNKFDKDAMALYINNKLVGYIPKEDLKDYIEFSERKQMKFIGTVTPFLDDEDKTKVAGSILFIKEDDDIKEDVTLITVQYKLWYKAEAKERIADYQYQLNKINQFKTLNSNTNNSNDSGGCLTGIIIAVILSLAALI